MGTQSRRTAKEWFGKTEMSQRIRSKSFLLTLICVIIVNLIHFQSEGKAGTMTDTGDGFSMFYHKIHGRILATKEIANVMAEMIIRNVYGDNEYNAQLPLTISDEGDRWSIEGSRIPRANKSTDEKNWTSGGIIIVILKENCQVVKFTQRAHIIKE